MIRSFLLFIFIILTSIASPLSAAEYTSNSFIIRDPVVGGLGSFGTGPSFQLFSNGDLVFNGRGSSSSFLARFGFLNFPFVTAPTVTATAGSTQVSLSWSASSAGLGFSVSGYEYGISTSSGGPYMYTNVGNVTSTISTGLTNGTTYYFVVRTLDAFGTPIVTSSEAFATPNGSLAVVNPTSGSIPVFIGVQFNGEAYPLATVTILKNAIARAVTRADESGTFAALLQEPYDRSILYTVYADDQDGERSLLLNYPFVAQEGVTPKISGIKFAPTITTNKIATKKNDPIEFKGFALPNTEIEIVVDGPVTVTESVFSQSSGRYSFSLETTKIPNGEYEIKAHYPGDKRYSLTVQFSVGPANILKNAIDTTLPGDCNKDNIINVKDFSVLAFWYERQNPPTCIDANSDGSITLVDFSILAYYWSGL